MHEERQLPLTMTQTEDVEQNTLSKTENFNMAVHFPQSSTASWCFLWTKKKTTSLSRATAVEWEREMSLCCDVDRWGVVKRCDVPINEWKEKQELRRCVCWKSYRIHEECGQKNPFNGPCRLTVTWLRGVCFCTTFHSPYMRRTDGAERLENSSHSKYVTHFHAAPSMRGDFAASDGAGRELKESAKQSSYAKS